MADDYDIVGITQETAVLSPTTILEVDQATQQARWQGRVRGLSQDGGK